MTCPTCSHTMEAVQSEPTRIFHCPRCGTMKQEFPRGNCATRWWTPKLIERVKDLREVMRQQVGFSRWDAETWHCLGITESIDLPDERFTPP